MICMQVCQASTKERHRLRSMAHRAHFFMWQLIWKGPMAAAYLRRDPSVAQVISLLGRDVQYTSCPPFSLDTNFRQSIIVKDIRFYSDFRVAHESNTPDLLIFSTSLEFLVCRWSRIWS